MCRARGAAGCTLASGHIAFAWVWLPHITVGDCWAGWGRPRRTGGRRLRPLPGCGLARLLAARITATGTLAAAFASATAATAPAFASTTAASATAVLTASAAIALLGFG